MSSEEKATLTVEQAARLLGIGRATAYEGVRTGAIPSLRIGRRILVSRAALGKLLEGTGAPQGSGSDDAHT